MTQRQGRQLAHRLERCEARLGELELQREPLQPPILADVAARLTDTSAALVLLRTTWEGRRALWDTRVLVLLGFGVVLLGATLALAAHGHWTDHYRGVGNLPCCGERDCHPVPGRLLQQEATETWVEIRGVRFALPTAAVHVSEDSQFWWCARSPSDEAPTFTRENTRCVFVAVGG